VSHAGFLANSRLLVAREIEGHDHTLKIHHDNHVCLSGTYMELSSRVSNVIDALTNESIAYLYN
jgi:hypothetical protein